VLWRLVGVPCACRGFVGYLAGGVLCCRVESVQRWWLVGVCFGGGTVFCRRIRLTRIGYGM